jgi:hypothetical protein
VRPALVGQDERDRRDRERGEDRHDQLQALPAPARQLEQRDERSEERGQNEVAPARLDHEADTDREHDMAEDGDDRPVAGPHGNDLADQANALRGRHPAALGPPQELVERSSLVEPQQPAQLSGRLDGGPLSRAERHRDDRREHGDDRPRRPVGRRHAVDALLDLVHSFTCRGESAREVEEELLEVVAIRLGRRGTLLTDGIHAVILTPRQEHAGGNTMTYESSQGGAR